MAAAIIIAACIAAISAVLSAMIANGTRIEIRVLKRQTNHIQEHNLKLQGEVEHLKGRLAGLEEGKILGRAAEQSDEAERQAGAAQARAEDAGR